MKQYLGINEQTGQRMFLSANQRIHYEISRCSSCGATQVLSHHVYKDKCEECGIALQNYFVNKNRINIRSSEKVLRTYYQKIMFWYDKAQQGFEAPSDVGQQKQIIEQYLEYLRQTRQTVEKHEIICTRCGVAAMVPVGVDDICEDCADRYKRYKALNARITRLTEEECDELHSIISTYVEDHKRGRWTPRTDVVLAKLRRRKHELGM